MPTLRLLHAIVRCAALCTIAAVSAPAHSDSTIGPGRPESPVTTCRVKKVGCTFSDRSGKNSYLVLVGELVRIEEGKELYRTRVASEPEKSTLAVASEGSALLAIAVFRETISTGALLGGGVGAFSAERSYRVSLRNPKSGEEIKAIDLGTFEPESIALTPAGDGLFAYGKDFQVNKKQVRYYSCRSGKAEYTRETRKESVTVFADGFLVGGEGFKVSSGDEGGTRKHSSVNPYSIAEFVVRPAKPLSRAAWKGKKIGIVRFDGASSDAASLLVGTTAIKLRNAGLGIVERERMDKVLEELRLQNLGITDSGSAARIGELANAQGMVFGQLVRSGSVTTFALRLVGTESGEVLGGIELDCRDCREDEQVEAIGFLVQDWVVE